MRVGVPCCLATRAGLWRSVEDVGAAKVNPHGRRQQPGSEFQGDAPEDGTRRRAASDDFGFEEVGYSQTTGDEEGWQHVSITPDSQASAIGGHSSSAGAVVARHGGRVASGGTTRPAREDVQTGGGRPPTSSGGSSNADARSAVVASSGRRAADGGVQRPAQGDMQTGSDSLGIEAAKMVRALLNLDGTQPLLAHLPSNAGDVVLDQGEHMPGAETDEVFLRAAFPGDQRIQEVGALLCHLFTRDVVAKILGMLPKRNASFVDRIGEFADHAGEVLLGFLNWAAGQEDV